MHCSQVAPERCLRTDRKTLLAFYTVEMRKKKRGACFWGPKKTETWQQPYSYIAGDLTDFRAWCMIEANGPASPQRAMPVSRMRCPRRDSLRRLPSCGLVSLACCPPSCELYIESCCEGNILSFPSCRWGVEPTARRCPCQRILVKRPVLPWCPMAVGVGKTLILRH